MVLFRAIFSSVLFFLSIYCCAQDISNLERLINSQNYPEAIDLVKRYDSTLSSMADSTKCDFYYLAGACYEAIGDTAKAKEYFEQECDLSERINRRDLSYVDGICRLVNYAYSSENYELMANLCQRGAKTSYPVMSQYEHAPWFYDSYVVAMNTLGKYSETESIVKDGLRYVKQHYTPADKEYYKLYFSDIVAAMLMGRYEQAEAELNEVIAVHESVGIDVVGAELANLQHHIAEKSLDWRRNKDYDIWKCIHLGESLLLCSPSSSEGAERWTAFFKLLQDKLKLLYFDTTDISDEEYWNKLLATLIVYFSTAGDELPNREQIAYDNILIRKNFLDYHSSKLHKKPIMWQDIRNSLSPNEAAIELTMCPDEILILRSEYQTPICVPLDSALMDRVDCYDASDAIVISSFYSENSPLCDIWKLIQPYISGCDTLYLSPSNVFAEFNFDAIAKVCGCNINLVQLTTTADIAYFKSTKNNIGNQTRNAAVFGGIDYGDARVSTSRGVFGYLPHSLSESIEVERLLKSYNYHVQMYSDKSATKLKFMSLDGTPNEIVHIATHAFCESNVVKDDSERTRTATILSKSGLLFANANNGLKMHSGEGVLTAKEIADIDLSSVSTVVLSGCSSAMGDLTNTTGLVYGVVNALKSSSVMQIVATLWDLPDELAAIAMEQFYSHFVKTADASTSLREMRQDLINLGYDNPYYWANFILIH